MNTLYKDSLVEVTDQEIVLHGYYFPFCNDRRVPLSQIAGVQVRHPSGISVNSGSLRIWGTGDFRTWFPMDWNRPGRDRIFVALLNNSSPRFSYRRIGFTVEDSQKVEGILKDLGLLSEI